MLKSLDHLVMTVRSIESSLDFYGRVLGAEIVYFGEGRVALQIGSQKINLHEAGAEIAPHAAAPIPGSVDICFLTDLPPAQIEERLDAAGVEIELGPVPRVGAAGRIESIYIRDPDGNLVEIARQCGQ